MLFVSHVRDGKQDSLERGAEGVKAGLGNIFSPGGCVFVGSECWKRKQ